MRPLLGPLLRSLRHRRVAVVGAALALVAGTVSLSAPAQADPWYVYPTSPSPVSISKAWSAGTVVNGGAVTATVTATNPSGVARDIIFQDTYDYGLSPDLPLPPGCGITSYSGYSLFWCNLHVPAMGSAVLALPFHAAYTGPARYTRNARTYENLAVEKVETYVSIPASSIQTFSVSCPAGYVMVDQSFHRLSVDQGTGTFADVQVVSSTLTGSGWSVVVANDALGQAQGKLFGACLSLQTGTGGTLAVTGIRSASVDNFLPVGDVPSEFEATCPAGETPVALNLNAAPANVNYATRHDTLTTVVGLKANGGRSATVFAVMHQPSDPTLQWRCLRTTSSSTYRMLFRNQTQSVVLAAGEEREVSVACDSGEKGIVGGWYGGPLNGSEPRPVTRTYWFRNTSTGPVTYRANLLCLGNRLVRGGHPKASATDERCNYLGGVEEPTEAEWLNHDEACVQVKQGS